MDEMYEILLLLLFFDGGQREDDPEDANEAAVLGDDREMDISELYIIAVDVDLVVQKGRTHVIEVPRHSS